MYFTILDFLEKQASVAPSRAGIVAEEGTLSFSELRDAAACLAGWLRAEGLARGARVGLCLPKSCEEVIATLGIGWARGVCVNLNYQWTIAQIDFVRQDCEMSILITDFRRAGQIAEAGLADRFQKILVVGDPPCDAMAPWSELNAAAPLLDRPLGADLAALMYTSGSTGRPKGVMITHGQICRGAGIVSGYLGVRPEDRILSVPPFSFDYGLNQLANALFVGCTLYLQKVAMPSAIAAVVDRWQITCLPLVAPSWVQLVRFLVDAGETLPSLRCATNTGGAIQKTTLEAMTGRFPNADIVLMYGLTEGFRSTYLPPSLFESKMGAIGRAIPNVEIFVVNSETGLCGPGEIGELVHRGDLISLGYWRQPEATAERIRVNEHLRPLLGEEKVLHSGDLVSFDDDGILWYVGRNDGLIKTSGHRVSSTEVEVVACDIQGVTAAVAFGVPDEDLGQVIHIVLETSGQDVSEDQVCRVLRSKLPGFMVPKKVRLWDGGMPRTGNGKIDRQTVVGEAGKLNNEVGLEVTE